MRLASGICHVLDLRRAGAPVGLGVDGSASNDSGHLLAEARQAMLLQRVAPDRYLSEAPGGRGGFAGNAGAMSAREALEIATRGSAAVLGRDDVGYLAPGMSADFIALNLNRVDYAGAWHDPAAAVLFCGPRGVDWSVINGRVVVDNGRLTTVDLDAHLPRHNAISRAMINGD